MVVAFAAHAVVGHVSSFKWQTQSHPFLRHPSCSLVDGYWQKPERDNGVRGWLDIASLYAIQEFQDLFLRDRGRAILGAGNASVAPQWEPEFGLHDVQRVIVPGQPTPPYELAQCRQRLAQFVAFLDTRHALFRRGRQRVPNPRQPGWVRPVHSAIPDVKYPLTVHVSQMRSRT